MQTQKISCKRHRSPPRIIAHAVWLYARFNSSLREVEEMLQAGGVDTQFARYRTARRQATALAALASTETEAYKHREDARR